MKKQLFEKVFIKSKSDLPKEEGMYFCYHKTGRMSAETFHFDTVYTAWISWWLVNIASYLQPIEQPVEKEQTQGDKKEDPQWHLNCTKCGKAYWDNQSFPAFQLCPECKRTKDEPQSSPAMSPKPQEEITDNFPDIDFRKDIAEELSRQELIDRLCEMHKSYTEMRKEWFDKVQMTANRREELEKFRLFWNRIPATTAYIQKSAIDLYLTSLNQKEEEK